jgi:16S rRNA processing protein RimM
LIGLQVITTEGDILGIVIDIIETGANDVYVVDNNGQQILLPAISDVVQSIDLTTRQIIVKLIDGLI